MKKTIPVQEFMDQLEHPFKAEVELLRQIIKGVNKDIVEEVKWNAPSFSYNGEYLVTFNLRAQEHIHLVFHNPMIPKVRSSLLEGDYPDRRMTYFADGTDILTKQSALEAILKNLIRFVKRSREHKVI